MSRLMFQHERGHQGPRQPLIPLSRVVADAAIYDGQPKHQRRPLRRGRRRAAGVRTRIGRRRC